MQRTGPGGGRLNQWPVGGREPTAEDRRDWFLGAAVAHLDFLARLAESDPELDDVTASFRYAADGWGELISPSSGPLSPPATLRLVSSDGDDVPPRPLRVVR